ncbi:uncharacterized protein CC84DRAFT_865643 [Paraphaeosphaeria sporulosa]|uniref:Uncharacterized protein n=1 Tax=Paraphaeosphaeria sporulosa TaxID=1460663 RepID=A0A177C8M1_9PLEO|nr:uncharacterized protein CC84DRAFT_865643 [Paraphaeosphaeria sporulosa]OAG03746.1 hypothetical protein CC84DRAFT_865643 [Paraphaeosphaeria sporulosa]
MWALWGMGFTNVHSPCYTGTWGLRPQHGRSLRPAKRLLSFGHIQPVLHAHPHGNPSRARLNHRLLLVIDSHRLTVETRLSQDPVAHHARITRYQQRWTNASLPRFWKPLRAPCPCRRVIHSWGPLAICLTSPHIARPCHAYSIRAVQAPMHVPCRACAIQLNSIRAKGPRHQQFLECLTEGRAQTQSQILYESCCKPHMGGCDISSRSLVPSPIRKLPARTQAAPV